MKRIFPVLLLLLLSIFMVLDSCSKKPDNPSPSPTPAKSYTHTISINGNVQGATFKLWTAGSALATKTADSQGDANFSITDNSENLSLDSLTGTMSGYKEWEVGAQTIGTSKSFTADLESLTNTFWVEGTTNADTVTGWLSGKSIISWTGTPGTYKTSTYSSTESSVTIDSLTFTGTGLIRYTKTGIAMQPNGTTVDATLDSVKYTLVGFTWNVTKDTVPSYQVTAARQQGGKTSGVTFMIFNKSGSFEKTVTSDASGNFSVAVPDTGTYAVMITPDIQTAGAGVVPMLYAMKLDSTANHQNIAYVRDDFNMFMFAQTDQGCSVSSTDPTKLTTEGAGTLNLSSTLKDNPNIVLVTRIYNNDGTYGEKIGQDTINTVLTAWSAMNRYTNDFFKNNITYSNSIPNFTDGLFAFAYMNNSTFAGLFNSSKDNGVVDGVIIRANMTAYTSTDINRIITGESARIFEGAYGDIFSNDDGSSKGSNTSVSEDNSIMSLNYPTSTLSKYDKQAMALYAWIQNHFKQMDNSTGGFKYPLGSTYILNSTEFSSLQIVEDFKSNYGL